MEPLGSILEIPSIYFSESFLKTNDEYQAAQRRVLGVRPNQRLQAR